MRRPEPWYWEARKGWYVQVNKRQIRLGVDESPKKNKAGDYVPSDAVSREYFRLMAVNGKIESKEMKNATIAEVVDLFIASKEKMRPATRRKHIYFLQALIDGSAKGKRLPDLKISDVERIAENSGRRWKSGSKYGFISDVKTLMAWAKNVGWLEFNHMAGYENPYPTPARTRGMTDEEFWLLMDKSKDLQFKQILQFLRGTGCRPGEAIIVEARHVHPVRPIVVLSHEEHKTGRRTGKARMLRMPIDVNTSVRALCEKYPKGPIFRNSRNGGGWKTGSIQRRFRQYRRKLGLGEDVTPYLIRHGAVTKMLDGGTATHLAAKIAGHSHSNMTQAVYYHPDEEKMLDEVNKAFDAGARKKPKP